MDSLYVDFFRFLVQVSELHLTTSDALQFMAAASSIPATVIGIVGLALWRKWNQTDKDLRTSLLEQTKLKQRVDGLVPCQCVELRETLRNWTAEQGDRLQVGLSTLEGRLDEHIDRMKL